MAVPMVAATTARRSWRRWSEAPVATAGSESAMAVECQPSLSTCRQVFVQPFKVDITLNVVRLVQIVPPGERLFLLHLLEALAHAYAGKHRSTSVFQHCEHLHHVIPV